MSQQKQKAQENAKIFLNQHNVEKIISEMINSLVHSKDPNPIIFMVSSRFNLKFCCADQVLVQFDHRVGTRRARHQCAGSPPSESAYCGISSV